MGFIIIFSILVITVIAIFIVNDLYVFVFLHKEWKLWHEIWNNIDTFKPAGYTGRYYMSDKFPNKRLVVWENNGSALFDCYTDECVLCSFYERYSKKCAEYLLNKHK